MPTPHVHAEVIKAFANGYTIETQDGCENWVECENPRWIPYKKYRVKPEKTKLTLECWVFPPSGNLIWRVPGIISSGEYVRIPSEDKIVEF